MYTRLTPTSRGLMMMRYGSLFSGVEAVSLAWQPLGMKPAFFAEVDPFCCELLKQRHTGVPNLGDVTSGDFIERACACGPVDVLVGGSPCQSFSTAGKRGGFGDARGNLTLRYYEIVEAIRPRWLVWENVPGVLSQDSGRAFGAVLGRVEELGYGWAYRVLDARFFGVPQRRRRVFVVGCLGDAGRARAVLFEPEGQGRDLAAGRPAWQGVARTAKAGAGVVSRVAAKGGNRTAGEIDQATSLSVKNRIDFESDTLLVEGVLGRQSHALTAKATCTEDGTGRGTPVVAYGISSDAVDRSGEGDGSAAQRAGLGIVEGVAPSIRARPTNAVAFQCQGSNVGEMGTVRSGNGHVTGGVPFVASRVLALSQNTRAETQEDLAYSLKSSSGSTERRIAHAEGHAYHVRRLTPRECERLMGFPDDWTLITYRGKPAKDAPRYKAIGNSMAVPVMHFIGQGLIEVSQSLTGNSDSNCVY